MICRIIILWIQRCSYSRCQKFWYYLCFLRKTMFFWKSGVRQYEYLVHFGSQPIPLELRQYKNDSMDWKKLFVLNLPRVFSHQIGKQKSATISKQTIFFSPSSSSYIFLALISKTVRRLENIYKTEFSRFLVHLQTSLVKLLNPIAYQSFNFGIESS